MIPKIRFPEFEGGSKYRKFIFNDIFLFSTGKNIKQKEASPDFEIPCVRYGELYHMYNEVISEVINRTNLDQSELLFSNGDEILLPSAGEDPLDIGSASALTLSNIAIGRTINILRPKEDNLYSQIYVSYYINQQLRKKISTLAKGVSISNVYNSDLKKLTIILPTPPEQTKIATFLTAVDKRINLLQKKKAELEQYKKGVMQKIFSQELRFKKDDGNDFPDWEEKMLGELFDFLRGSGLSKNDISENGVNKCIHYGQLFTMYSEKIDIVVSRTNVDGNKSQIGDILMPSSDVTPTGLATASVVFEDDVILGGDINVLRPKTIVDTLYISYLLNLSKKQIIKLVTGTTVKHIYNKDVKQLKFTLPKSEQEQQKTANFLSSIDKSIEKMGNQIDDSVVFKQGLLQKMFV